MATDQFGYLWRNDDGTEITATDAALEDVSVSSAVGTSLRLRIGVDATTDPASSVPTLQVRTPTGPWQDVPLETSTGPTVGDGLLQEIADFLLLDDLWDPSNHGTVSGHWDAADADTITLNGTDVVSWADKSGNGHHFVTDEDTVDRPSYSGSRQINSINVLDFDGTQWMNTAANVQLQNATDGTYTVAVVVVLDDHTSTSNYQIISSDTTSGSDRLPQFLRGYNSNMETIPFQVSSAQTDGQASASATTYVAVAVANRDSSEVWLNDTSGGSTTFTAADINHAGNNELFLASKASATTGTLGFNGAIAEIVIWSEALSTADREAAQVELSDKWGLTTPTADFLLLE